MGDILMVKRGPKKEFFIACKLFMFGYKLKLFDMRNAILLSQFDVAEVQLIYKSKLPASQRKKITCSRDAYDLLLKNWNSDTVEYCEEFKILLMNRSNAG
jgi:hypothetical protein